MSGIYDAISNITEPLLTLWDNYKWWIIPIFIGLCYWFIFKMQI